jgi:hypothetical protein
MLIVSCRACVVPCRIVPYLTASCRIAPCA